MTPEQDGKGQDDIRVVPPGQEDAELISSHEAAMEQLGAERRGEVDKELKALEKVHAKHAKRLEKAARKAGVDPDQVHADLEALSGLTAEDDEQAQELGRRLGEVGRKYRARQDTVLKEAGVERDALAQEVLATTAVPEHARARGRRGQGGDGAGGEDLGWANGAN